MAHDHHRAFELVQRHAERFARRQIEVVGRLVEEQQVRALPDQHGEHEPRLLAARERADGLLHHRAGEAERAEEVAQLLLAAGGADVACQPHHVHQRAVAGREHVELLLREVADREALAGDDLARERRQVAGDRLDERGLALAIGAEDADALAGEHRAVDVVDDALRAGAAFGRIAAGDVSEREHRIGQALRLLELELEVGAREHRRELFHPRQRLDAALRLLGLARLGLEAVDELLQVRHAFLLLLEALLRLHHSDRAHLLERRVVAGVAGELGLVEMHGDLGDGVEELAVVADDDHRAAVALQPGFEPDEGVEVQVVRRLVEQHQVGRAHQRAGELQAHAPAAREAVDRLVELGALEAEAEQHCLRARSRVEAAGFADRNVRVRHRLAVVARLRGSELGFGLRESGVASEDEVGRALVGLRHLLRDLGNAPAARDRDIAGVGLQTAGEQREQRRLAGAVAADEADLFAGLDGQAGFVEDELDAAAQRQLGENEHARFSPARRIGARRIARRGRNRISRAGRSARSARPDRRRRWSRARRIRGARTPARNAPARGRPR